MLLNIHTIFLGPNYMARQATEAEKKLKNLYYDGEKKGRIGTNMLHFTAHDHGQPC